MEHDGHGDSDDFAEGGGHFGNPKNIGWSKRIRVSNMSRGQKQSFLVKGVFKVYYIQGNPGCTEHEQTTRLSGSQLSKGSVFQLLTNNHLASMASPPIGQGHKRRTDTSIYIYR